MGRLRLKSKHRLKCGDSTNAEHVAECLAGATPFIMVTDPPYGVEYDPNWRNEAAEAGHLAFSASRVGEVANDDRVDWTEAWKLFGGDVVYVWHAGLFASDVDLHLRAANFVVRWQIIWRKSSFAISRGHYHCQHEPCWYSVRNGKTAKWAGDRSQSTTWDINPVGKGDRSEDGEDAATIHGTQKPVECMARPIRNHGGPEDDVYDPFCGSGTTIIACEQLGRRGFFLELEPRYADVCVTRWSRFTQGEPVLEETGETFSQVKERRAAEAVLNQPAEVG